MELTPKQQTIELLRRAQKILILTHQNPDGDALGSLLALYLALGKLGKKVTAAVADLGHQSLKFLPALKELKQEIRASEEMIITLDTSKVTDVKLGYRNRPEENKVDILVSPKEGRLTPADLSFTEGEGQFDAAVILDTPDLDRLGSLYEQNSELFYRVPTVNIDHHPSNDRFGKINWIDLTATSTAEILVSLLESLGRQTPLLDEDIATALLTGIICDTTSFQNSNTTPKSFTVAAQLVATGARQQEIIKAVYKTKTLSTLKLWGKILSRVQVEPENFVWSYATSDDLAQAGAQDNETSGVVDELLKSTAGVDFALLLVERDGGIHGSLRSIEKIINVNEIARVFGGGGHESAAAFRIEEANLADKQAEILAKISQFQAKTRGMVSPSPEKKSEGESAESCSEDIRPAEPVSKW